MTYRSTKKQGLCKETNMFPSGQREAIERDSKDAVWIQVLLMSRKICNTVSVMFLFTTYMELQIVYTVWRYSHIFRRKDWKWRGSEKTFLIQDQLTWMLSRLASHSEQWIPTWTHHIFLFSFFFLPERLSEFVYFAWQISVFLSALPSVLKWAEICLKCHILASLRVLIISIFLTLYIRVAFPYSSLICCFIGWILLANWLFISHNKAHIHAINHCMLELRIMESSPRWLYHTYCAIYMDVKSHL